MSEGNTKPSSPAATPRIWKTNRVTASRTRAGQTRGNDGRNLNMIIETPLKKSLMSFKCVYDLNNFSLNATKETQASPPASRGGFQRRRPFPKKASLYFLAGGREREIRSARELNAEIVRWRRRGPLASLEASLDMPAEKPWTPREGKTLRLLMRRQTDPHLKGSSLFQCVKQLDCLHQKSCKLLINITKRLKSHY